ncbi:MAG: coproporphyrinogen III oxidase family protein [Gemmataceae bacterium]|nr:coproporphyrinogen III oxidase family protein [Gemmataceae bacterium]
MTRPPPWLDPRAAYVHVPFCGHHCGYCDFAVTAGRDHLIELYLDALEMELAGLGEPRPVETVFIGGGTPTYLSADQLGRLLRAVERWLPLARPGEPAFVGWVERSGSADRDGTPGGVVGRRGPRTVRSTHPTGPTPAPEFSIESTPESLAPEKAAVLADFGVTRVSIGVQSFRPDTLAALDRRHTADQIPRAVEAVRRQEMGLSFDLIFGAPGTTLESWAADLDAALGYEPDHISTYGLTYEKGTPLWKDRRAGRVRPVGEDAELAMYEHAIDRLTAAGFEHYEVSNFARPGKRCRHNERYWANEAYYGFGVGAARYVGGVRELNTRDTQAYIRKVLAGESPTFQSECLGPRDRASETIGTQLRRAEGIGRLRFHEQTGFSLDDLVGDRVSNLVAAGLLADGDSVRLTRRGMCVADGVIEELMRENPSP